VTRRRRPWPRRHPALTCLAITAATLAWRAGHHWPAIALTLAAAATPAWWAARHHDTIRRWLRPTVVYRHRCSGLQGTFCRRGKVAYVGISNRPDLRRTQHAAGSWWYPLTDPALYSERWHRTRLSAAVTERWLIRAYRPVGNIQHNGAYRRQTTRRAALQQIAQLITGTPTRRELTAGHTAREG
jgi:hypothetical protein